MFGFCKRILWSEAVNVNAKEKTVIDTLNRILQLKPFSNPFEEYCVEKETYSTLGKYVFKMDISIQKIKKLSPINILSYAEYSYLSYECRVDVSIKDYDNQYKKGFYADIKKVIAELIRLLNMLDNDKLLFYTELYKTGIDMVYDLILNDKVNSIEIQNSVAEILSELYEDIKNLEKDITVKANQTLQSELEFIRKYKQKRTQEHIGVNMYDESRM